MTDDEPDRLIGSVRKRVDRLKHAHHEAKPSVSRQIGQIGIIGVRHQNPAAGQGLLLAPQ